MCTFCYVDSLARAGRLTEAELTFQEMFTYASHLGLYSEEIGLTGEQLGNFPRPFSHLALIGAAINLDYQLEHRRERGSCPVPLAGLKKNMLPEQDVRVVAARRSAEAGRIYRDIVPL